MSSKFTTSLEQQNHPHNIQLFVKLKCEWSCYTRTIKASIQFIYHERMFSSKLSQDFRIMVQHQNFANNIEFKKKREIGINIL